MPTSLLQGFSEEEKCITEIVDLENQQITYNLQ